MDSKSDFDPATHMTSEQPTATLLGWLQARLEEAEHGYCTASEMIRFLATDGRLDEVFDELLSRARRGETIPATATTGR